MSGFGTGVGLEQRGQKLVLCLGTQPRGPLAHQQQNEVSGQSWKCDLSNKGGLFRAWTGCQCGEHLITFTAIPVPPAKGTRFVAFQLFQQAGGQTLTIKGRRPIWLRDFRQDAGRTEQGVLTTGWAWPTPGGCGKHCFLQVNLE